MFNQSIGVYVQLVPFDCSVIFCSSGGLHWFSSLGKGPSSISILASPSCHLVLPHCLSSSLLISHSRLRAIVSYMSFIRQSFTIFCVLIISSGLLLACMFHSRKWWSNLNILGWIWCMMYPYRYFFVTIFFTIMCLINLSYSGWYSISCFHVSHVSSISLMRLMRNMFFTFWSLLT